MKLKITICVNNNGEYDMILSDFNAQKIAVETSGRTQIVEVSDIICFEAFGDGTYIYTKDEVIESGKTLKYWMDIVGNDYFFQTHKSYIVSLEYVKCIKDVCLEMKYLKQSIPVSRRRMAEFKQRLFQYLE